MSTYKKKFEIEEELESICPLCENEKENCELCNGDGKIMVDVRDEIERTIHHIHHHFG